MTSEPLRELLAIYDELVTSLNEAIDKEVTATNALSVAKSEVKKKSHSLGLVKEQIMCEKKLIDASR